MDDPMICCPRPKADGNSSSGHPKHRGGDNLTVAQKDLNSCFITQLELKETSLTNKSHDL